MSGEHVLSVLQLPRAAFDRLRPFVDRCLELFRTGSLPLLTDGARGGHTQRQAHAADAVPARALRPIVRETPRPYRPGLTLPAGRVSAGPVDVTAFLGQPHVQQQVRALGGRWLLFLVVVVVSLPTSPHAQSHPNRSLQASSPQTLQPSKPSNPGPQTLILLPKVYQALTRREARLRARGLPLPRNPHDNLAHGGCWLSGLPHPPLLCLPALHLNGWPPVALEVGRRPQPCERSHLPRGSIATNWPSPHRDVSPPSRARVPGRAQGATAGRGLCVFVGSAALQAGQTLFAAHLRSRASEQPLIPLPQVYIGEEGDMTAQGGSIMGFAKSWKSCPIHSWSGGKKLADMPGAGGSGVGLGFGGRFPRTK